MADWDPYVANIGKDKEYADYPCIIAAAEVYGRTIVLHSDLSHGNLTYVPRSAQVCQSTAPPRLVRSRGTLQPDRDDAAAPILLSWLMNKCHYNPLYEHATHVCIALLLRTANHIAPVRHVPCGNASY